MHDLFRPVLYQCCVAVLSCREFSGNPRPGNLVILITIQVKIRLIINQNLTYTIIDPKLILYYILVYPNVFEPLAKDSGHDFG
uniref:Putative secreted protein n=1 Tax=Xenopsylla cheopis TaxID=163159 RepID=A0A6M2DN42_XENCH